MLNFLGRWLPEISFLRKLSLLVGGTAAGQAIVIASSPLLTRLFTPEEFGLFAVFSSVAGIAGVIVGLRYEFTIPMRGEDADAAAMVVITALIVLANSFLATLLVGLFGPWFAGAIDAPGLFFWLWFLPPAMLVWGLGSVLSYWSVRRGTYGINGLNRTLQLGGQSGGQIALGFFGAGGPGLILGYLLGYIVRLAHHVCALPRHDRRLFVASARPALLWRNGRKNWRYPAFAFPSGLLHSSCELAPAILLAAFYGPTMAGWYALSQRIMALPVQMLSQAASQVFLGEMRSTEGRSLHRLFLRTIVLFTGLGLAGMLPLLLFGPAIFAFVFGEAWREAGIIVQLLVPLYLVRFIVLPISQLLYALDRQAIHLLSAGLNALALVGSFGASHLLALEARTTILLFSLGSSLSFLLYLTISWQFARATRDPAAVLER